MAVYKDAKRGTWYSQVSYVDNHGERQRTTKRGFETRKAALAWEKDYLALHTNAPSMTLNAFYKQYEEDKMPRVKLNTWLTKKHIIETKILPELGEIKLSEITAADILRWENGLLSYRDRSGADYSQTYLRTICTELSSMLNHACRFYGLRSNPMATAGKIGSTQHDEMKIWTPEQYERFAEVMRDKPMSYHAFELLYWCGLRLGELLALTKADFDLDNDMLSVTKSYQRLNRKDIITTPKTAKSVRKIVMPKFLTEEMREFFRLAKYLNPRDRIFQMSKSYMHHEMDRGCKEAGLDRIRIHDLRHSHVSLLIELEYSIPAIAERMGHESTDITFQYAHLFPNKQSSMAKDLDKYRGDE